MSGRTSDDDDTSSGWNKAASTSGGTPRGSVIGTRRSAPPKAPPPVPGGPPPAASPSRPDYPGPAQQGSSLHDGSLSASSVSVADEEQEGSSSSSQEEVSAPAHGPSDGGAQGSTTAPQLPSGTTIPSVAASSTTLAPQPAQTNNPAPPPAPIRRAEDAVTSQDKRRWSIWAGSVLGVPSIKGQGGIAASALAVKGRVDQDMLQPGTGPHCAAALSSDQALMANATYATFVTALNAFEGQGQPRSVQNLGTLATAATTARSAALNASTVSGAATKQEADVIAACDEVLNAKAAMDLSDEIRSFGMPPWTGQRAERATAAKLELDLRSMPAGQRQLVDLDPTKKGVNKAYWVERSDAVRGSHQHSFLVKPANDPNASVPAVDGIPNGGEVAREAVVGRMAAALAKVMPLDLEMPETHVMNLPGSFLPGGGANKTCSVQQAKKPKCDVTAASFAERARVPASQCAALAVLDLMTLNTDRHSGNVLLDGSGNLIPIDHGCAFPSDDEDGRNRISLTIAGPHNALLRIPGSHQPMTEELAAGLRGVDPMHMASTVKAEQTAVETGHPDMTGMITDASILMAVRSARFMKLAGGIKSGKRRLTPAAVQVAFGSNSAELLALPLPSNPANTKAFDKRATQILKQALVDQPLVQQACLMDDTAWYKMKSKLAALGWTGQTRNEESTNGISVDPALCLKLIASAVQCPPPAHQNSDSLAVARAALAAAKGRKSTSGVMSAAVGLEMEAINDLIALMPADAGRAAARTLAGEMESVRSDTALRRSLMERLTKLVETHLKARWATLTTQWSFPSNSYAPRNIEGALQIRDFASAATQIDALQADIASGQLATTAKQAVGAAQTQAAPPPNAVPPPVQPAQGGVNG